MKLVLVLMLLLVFVGGASAATLYVDTDGSGDYNCDGTDDHIEINYAISNASSGDIVHLNASTYMFNDSIDFASNIIFEGDSEDTVIIKLKDQNNRKNWNLLEGSVVTNTTLRFFTFDGNLQNQTGVDQNDLVQGMHFLNSDNITIMNITSKNVFTDNFRFSNTDDSNIQNCTATDSHHDGYMIGDSDRVIVSDNLAWNLGAHGTRFYNTKDSIFERNDLYSGDYGILDCGGGSGVNSGNIFRDNYIDNTKFANFAAIKINPGDSSTVENETFVNNIIDTVIGPGFWIQGSGTVDNIRVINNVFRGCNAASNGYGIQAELGTNIAVTNNIIDSCTLYGIYGNGITSTYNNVYNCGSGTHGGGASAGTGDIAQDPLFANVSGHDFHLNSTAGRWNGSAWVTDVADSPCIDAGNTSSDYSNEPAPNGSRINIGRYGNTDEASKTATSPQNVDIYVNTTGWYRQGAAFNATGTPIQHAVDNASSYNTIYIWNGSYTENVDVPTAHLTIEGEGASVVTVSVISSADHTFHIQNNYINISGLNVSGATGAECAGIMLTSSRDNCIVSDIITHGNYHGVSLYSLNCNNTIINCTAYNNSHNGFFVYSSSNYNTITNCTAHDNLMRGFEVSQSSYNHINNSTAYNGSYGVLLATNSQHNLIYGCTIYNVTHYGIPLSGNCAHNTVNNNNISGCGYYGIWFYAGCNNNSAANNIINDIDLYGMVFTTSNDTVCTNDTLINEYYRLESASSNITLVDIANPMVDVQIITADSDCNMEFTDGTIFKSVLTFGSLQGYPTYYTSKSNATLHGIATHRITTYNGTLLAQTTHCKNVSVHGWVESGYNISVNSSNATEICTFAVCVETESDYYGCYVDGSWSETIQAVDSVASWEYTGGFTAHDLDIKWNASSGWSPLNNGNYWNSTDVIEITVKSDKTHVFSRTPTQADNNSTSFRIAVRTT